MLKHIVKGCSMSFWQVLNSVGLLKFPSFIFVGGSVFAMGEQTFFLCDEL